MTQPSTDSQIQALLENPEHVESLIYLASKLPELTKAMQWVEEKTEFVQHVLQDKQSLGVVLGEAEDKLKSLHLTQEHADAMMTLTQKLPALVKQLEQIEALALFMREVVTDKASMTYIAEGLREMPFAQQGFDILKETNQSFRYEKDYPNISLLRIYKLLKHPMLNKGFRYLETLLDTIQKHSKS